MHNTIESKTIQDEVWSCKKIEEYDISMCTFHRCDFVQTNFIGTKFIDCTFRACNFSQTIVANCSFHNVSFVECPLRGIIFSEINKFLLDWTFDDCMIDLCNFSGLEMKKSHFTRSVIQETDFVNVDLTGSDFSNSDLKGSTFHNANLAKTCFIGAQNYVIDPTVNKLAKAEFSSPEVLSLLSVFDIVIK